MKRVLVFLTLIFFQFGCSEAGCPVLAKTQNGTKVWRILGFGDSLTAGIDHASYRYYLHRDLILAGRPNNMVGPLEGNNNCPTTLYCDKDNMGVEGYNCSTWLTIGGGVSLFQGVKAADPDIIIVNLGTNMFQGRTSPDQGIIDLAISDYDDLLDQLKYLAPGAKIICSSLTPNCDNRWDPLLMQDYNAALLALTVTKSVYFWDAWTPWGAVTCDDFYGTVGLQLHWSDSGEQKYAAIMVSAVKTVMGWN